MHCTNLKTEIIMMRKTGFGYNVDHLIMQKQVLKYDTCSWQNLHLK